MKWLVQRFQNNRLRLFHLELKWYLASWSFEGDDQCVEDIELARKLMDQLMQGIRPGDDSWNHFVTGSLALRRIAPLNDSLSNHQAATRVMAHSAVVALRAACMNDWARAYQHHQFVHQHRTLIGVIAGNAIAAQFFNEQAERERAKAERERKRVERCMRRFANLADVDPGMLPR